MEDTSSDFNNIIGKFNHILKEKNINLGELLGDQDKQNKSFDFDLDTILKIKNIYQKMSDMNNPRNRLLYSLKPFLRESRKQKLDEYVRIANLLSIISLINDSNLGKGGNS